MATFTKPQAGPWAAMIRMKGWPIISKTPRTKCDAKDLPTRAEDRMVRGVFIQRGVSECLLFEEALDRYLKEVTTTKGSARFRE
jgi:hypothetical protein